MNRSNADVVSFCRSYYKDHEQEINTLFQWQASGVNMKQARHELARACGISREESVTIWNTWRDNLDGFRLLYNASRRGETY